MSFLSFLIDIIINVGEFFIFTVCLKMIVAHAIADYFMKYAERYVTKNPRYRAIWDAEMAKVHGLHHKADTL